ncbi:hypothetical protein [Pontibacter sp. SGAir0037]|uniref:hypothetical protein n=1 Tax=Pontibacter sp. SGAir0037 TaxID=2571030 RepID=UPI0010CD51AF|nr:hypothetical protein [Pontibacter sp. SGAir0037]QCR24787.1 hypothetical protein C1N53_22140 [Pontibacter sp. SGAir0037]
MSGKKLKSVLTVIALIFIAWFVYDSFSQPGPQDLKGEFKEEAFYRNENNTGPIVRVYAVSVADTLWAEMQQYGEYMPHTKYGNTKVYFFLKGSPVPKELIPGQESFEATYKPYCVALYEKNAMSQVNFTKRPF